MCLLVFKTSRWALVASWVGSIPTRSRHQAFAPQKVILGRDYYRSGRNVDRFRRFRYNIIKDILNLSLGHFSPLCQKIVDAFIYLWCTVCSLREERIKPLMHPKNKSAYHILCSKNSRIQQLVILSQPKPALENMKAYFHG